MNARSKNSINTVLTKEAAPESDLHARIEIENPLVLHAHWNRSYSHACESQSQAFCAWPLPATATFQVDVKMLDKIYYMPEAR